MSYKKRIEYLNLKSDSLGKKYEFESNIKPTGEGGSGIVYPVYQVFGEHTKTKRAVKFFIYNEKLMMENKSLVSHTNYDTEIQNLARLNHHNVLKVVDGGTLDILVDETGKKEHVPYTITEYIDGKNLQEAFNSKKWMEDNISNEETVFKIILDILNAIEYLHQENFYHCDIAPKNIFVQGRKDKVFAIVGDLGAGYTMTLVPVTNVVKIAST